MSTAAPSNTLIPCTKEISARTQTSGSSQNRALLFQSPLPTPSSTVPLSTTFPHVLNGTDMSTSSSSIPPITRTPPFAQSTPSSSAFNGQTIDSSKSRLMSQLSPLQVQCMQQQFFSNMGISPSLPQNRSGGNFTTTPSGIPPSSPSLPPFYMAHPNTPLMKHTSPQTATSNLLPKPVPIDAFRGRIVDVSREETGCRMLLRILEHPTASDLSCMHSEVLASRCVGSLLSGRHSLYFMQRLFEVSTIDQVTELLRHLTADVVTLSRNSKGTYAMRKVVDVIAAPCQARILIQGFLTDIWGILTDTNGSQVVRRLLKKIHNNEWGSSELLRPVITYMCENMVLIGRDPHGCCVVQRVMDIVDNRCKAELIGSALQVCNELVSDPYGNYIIQYILDLNKEYISVQLAGQFMRDLRNLAMNKYSSNVVEKCLAMCPNDVRDMMILQLCVNHTALDLLQDDFGNYVVQTALKVATPLQLHLLRQTLLPYLHTIKSDHVRKRVEQRLHPSACTVPRTTESNLKGNNSSAKDRKLPMSEPFADYHPPSGSQCSVNAWQKPCNVALYGPLIPLEDMPPHLAVFHPSQDISGSICQTACNDPEQRLLDDSLNQFRQEMDMHRGIPSTADADF